MNPDDDREIECFDLELPHGITLSCRAELLKGGRLSWLLAMALNMICQLPLLGSLMPSARACLADNSLRSCLDRRASCGTTNESP